MTAISSHGTAAPTAAPFQLITTRGAFVTNSWRLPARTLRHVSSPAAWMLFAAPLIAVASTAFAAPAIDQSHVISSSVGGLSILADYSPAQTFTVGAAGKLSKVDVQIGRDSGANGNLSLEIYPTTGGAPSGSPLFSTPISASSIPIAGPSASLPFTSVDLSAANLNVTPGQQYAIALRGTAGFDDPNPFWNWGSPGYSGGNPYDSAFGQPWDEVNQTFDFGFRTWVDAAAPTTQSLSFTPKFDVAAQSFGALGFGISEGGNAMRVRRNFSGTDDRAVMEFDISAIPDNATIESASFTFDINQWSEGVNGPYPVVRLYGYSGNGQAHPSDASQLTRVLGTSPEIDSSERVVMPLDAANIAHLRFSSDYLGIVGYQEIPPYHVDIVTTELAANFPSIYKAPTLSITFSVPPPTPNRPGDYNGNGIEDAADYTVWRDSLGQSGSNLPADGDGNGSVGQNDYLVWKNAFANRPDPGVRNGDFADGLDEWETIVDPNTNVSSGFPRTESFDVDGDGTADNAMRIRLGRINASLNEGGRAGLDQEVLLLEAGDYLLSTDFAAASFQDFGNTAPGRFELFFDDVLVDVVDLNGTTIEAFQVMRGSLEATLSDVIPGYHKLGLRVHRPGTNSRDIYQYFDNIALSLVSSLDTAAVPEPGAAILSLLAVGGLFSIRNHRASR
jgi:hypothetical protein